MLFASRATTQMRPLRRNPKGRGFPGDLHCRAARPWGLPRASRRFAHLIPESLRRGHAGLIQRFPTTQVLSELRTRVRCLTHSKRHTAAAAAALSDSNPPGIGMLAVTREAASTAAERPLPSLPMAIAIGPVRSTAYSGLPPAATAAATFPR